MPSLILRELREQVWGANQALVRAGLVTLSFGNASGVDRAAGVFLIKPSGVPYERLRPQDLVAVSLIDGSVVEGDMRPSSDTPTHLSCTDVSRRSAGSCIPIPPRQSAGPRPAGRSRRSEPRTPTTSTVRCR